MDGGSLLRQCGFIVLIAIVVAINREKPALLWLMVLQLLEHLYGNYVFLSKIVGMMYVICYLDLVRTFLLMAIFPNAVKFFITD